MGKDKIKKNAVLMIAIFAIIMSLLSPALSAFADLEESEKKFNKESAEFFKEAESATDMLEILESDGKINKKPERNSISYVMRRLFGLGVYVNDVRDGVLSTSIKEDKENIVYKTDKIKGSICHPKAPKNLIHHNCNIPNFTTGLIQNITVGFDSPLSGAEKTTAYSTFGLGVPKNIPGGKVPVDPEKRKHTYTAMELFGYDLKLTAYSGEWDQITISNSARMLSNFGLIDKITLTGTTLWNTTKDGLSKAIENFSWNPMRWIGNTVKAFEAGASSGINTIVDTSELNIVATNGWKRPNIDRTLYNVYVMSDKEVLNETARNYFELFHSSLMSKAEDNEQLNKVMSLKINDALKGIEFKYDPKMETEESKEARKEAEKQREKDIAHNESEKEMARMLLEYDGIIYEPKLRDLTKIPKKKFYTEKEQLGMWEEDPDVASVLSLAREEGILNKESADEYSKYSDLKSEWEENYEPYFQSNFDAMGDTIQEILDENDSELFQDHPHLDPKQGISKYACMNDDGTIMRKENGTVEYLYTANNSGTKEFLNDKCKVSRTPIGGGMFGTGDTKGVTDTRHISMVQEDSAITGKINNVFTSTVRSLNSFIAKITNVILGMAFSPILDSLGINTIISKLIESFRDSIFFPLAGLTAAIAALLVFIQLLKNGSAWQLFSSITGMLLIFIVGGAFLLHPTATINLVDEFPAKLDKVISDTILGGGDDNSYCSTGEDKDGIRSAQCGVWGAMVFEPWVHLQFGTGYNNLYANGYAPSGGSSFENENQDLVGNAEVNLGNGTTVNNWAMYQLSKTKYGTINSKDTKAKYGMIDKDMYRLVDLQAGPRGSGFDAKHFDDWSGKRSGGFLIVLTLAQAILMSLTISLLGFAKIEVSLMFSLSVLFLPFMLLYGLLPKGRSKLIGYLSSLVSLLLKRIVIVLMISVLLKIVMAVISNSSTLVDGAMISISISVAFLLYRKEILGLITATESAGGLLSGDPQQLKEILGDAIPKTIKQKYAITKANVKGGVAGAIGGAAGALEHKATLRARRAGIRTSLIGLTLAERLRKGERTSEEQIKKKERLIEQNENVNQMIANSKKLSDLDYEKIMKSNQEKLDEMIKTNEELARLYKDSNETNESDDPYVKERIKDLERYADRLEKEIQKGEMILRGGVRKGKGVRSSGLQGFGDSMNIIGRRAERKIRTEGLTAISAYSDIKEAVLSKGAKDIADGVDLEAHDVYKEQLSHSKERKSKSSTEVTVEEQGQLLNRKVQRSVRKMAKKKKDIVNPSRKSKVFDWTKLKDSPEFKTAALSDEDIKELQKAANLIDKKRGGNIFDRAKNPMLNKKLEKTRDEAIEAEKKRTSRVKDMIENIEEDVEKYKQERAERLNKGERSVNPDYSGHHKGEEGQPEEPIEIFYEREKSREMRMKNEAEELKEMEKKAREKAKSTADEIEYYRKKIELKEEKKRQKREEDRGDGQ